MILTKKRIIFKIHKKKKKIRFQNHCKKCLRKTKSAIASLSLLFSKLGECLSFEEHRHELTIPTEKFLFC